MEGFLLDGQLLFDSGNQYLINLLCIHPYNWEINAHEELLNNPNKSGKLEDAILNSNYQFKNSIEYRVILLELGS